MVMKYTHKSTIRFSKNTKPNSAAILELSWSRWQPHQLPHPFCKSHKSYKEQHLSCFSNLHNCKPLCSSHPHQLLFNGPPDLISVIPLAKYWSSSFDYSRPDWNPNIMPNLQSTGDTFVFTNQYSINESNTELQALEKTQWVQVHSLISITQVRYYCYPLCVALIRNILTVFRLLVTL